jgi:hypothetical protein
MLIYDPMLLAQKPDRSLYLRVRSLPLLKLSSWSRMPSL